MELEREGFSAEMWGRMHLRRLILLKKVETTGGEHLKVSLVMTDNCVKTIKVSILYVSITLPLLDPNLFWMHLPPLL